MTFRLFIIALTASAAVQLRDHGAFELYALQSVPGLHGDAEAVVSERRRVGEGRGAVAYDITCNDVTSHHVILHELAVLLLRTCKYLDVKQAPKIDSWFEDGHIMVCMYTYMYVYLILRQ